MTALQSLLASLRTSVGRDSFVGPSAVNSALSRSEALRGATLVTSPRRMYVLAPDLMAGLPNRYTLYMIRLDTKRTRIIGRELDEKTIKAVIDKREEKHRV